MDGVTYKYKCAVSGFPDFQEIDAVQSIMRWYVQASSNKAIILGFIRSLPFSNYLWRPDFAKWGKLA